MKNVFVSFANRTVTAFRNYSTKAELYELVKDSANWSIYMIAVENGKVVYEFKRGASPVVKNRSQFVCGELRDMTEKDLKRIRYAYSRRLVNCDVSKFDKMMAEAEKSGVV